MVVEFATPCRNLTERQLARGRSVALLKKCSRLGLMIFGILPSMKKANLSSSAVLLTKDLTYL